MWRKRSDNGKELDETMPFDGELTSKNIQQILSNSSDIIYQTHYINGRRDIPVFVVFVEGLVDMKVLNDDVLKPLTQETALDMRNVSAIIDLVLHGTVYHGCRKLRTSLKETLDDVLSGQVALVFDREKKAVTLDIKGYEKRSIQEPTTENAMKGSKDSFIEDLRINTSLVRRKIKSPNLRIVETKVGEQTNTSVAVVYMHGLTNENIIKSIFRRLEGIKIDGVLSTGNIEEYIKDQKFTIFPQMLSTERTDKFCHNILEGRVGLIIDGLPVTYIIPGELVMFYQAPEDYSQNFIFSSFIRFIRHMGALITVFLPGFYVSITTFHQEMIPTVLAASIIRSKAEVPFPTVTSVFIMLVAFEILLEAGLRLPKAIGQAVSIIGALVVGQSAVQAKLISPVVVIVIAVTGISGFIIPNQDYANALRLIRIVLVFAASLAGLYALALCSILLIHHVNTIENFGVPYFTPMAANEGRDIAKDTIIRLPLRYMKKRPSSLKTTNKQRQE